MPDPIQTVRSDAEAIHQIVKDSVSRTIPNYELQNALVTGVLAFQDKTVINLESLQPNPKRKRARVTVYDTASFIAYVLAHRITNVTAIFVNTGPSGATFTAILDYHHQNQVNIVLEPANWGEHVCILELRTTPEWQTWFGNNNKPIGQEAFAEFILDNRRDIVRPDAGILMDVARLLVAKKSVDFKSGINLKTGANHLEFVETIEARGVASRVEDAMDVPDTFVLGIVPFIGGDGVEIEAQLRFRIHDRKLSFVYVMLQPHKIIEAAVQAARARVEAELGFVYYGGASITPPPALK